MGKCNLQINYYLRKILNDDQEISNWSSKLKFLGITILNIWVFNVCCMSLKKEHASSILETVHMNLTNNTGETAWKIQWLVKFAFTSSSLQSNDLWNFQRPKGSPGLTSCCVGENTECMISFLLKIKTKQLFPGYFYFKGILQEKGNFGVKGQIVNGRSSVIIQGEGLVGV